MSTRPRSRVTALDEDLARSLDERLCAPQDADEALLDRVRNRVMSAIRSQSQAQSQPQSQSQSQSQPSLHTVRASAGGWEPMAPGVLCKVLWTGKGARSCMVRMEPGSRVGSHFHPMDEECVVLEGTLRIGNDLTLTAGDFHVGGQGSAHEDAWTETGALVFLRGALEEA